MASLRPMLLAEPQTLLRQTISLTLRSLGLADMHEARSSVIAHALLDSVRFEGAVIALDSADAAVTDSGMGLIDRIRSGRSRTASMIPIVVLVDQCSDEMLAALRDFRVNRIILRPFRARSLIDVFADLAGNRPENL